jgi:membrane protein implicated in regulation of membrane protease activity
MIWWYWVVLGLTLAAIELATPGGFYVIFFAVGALAVGALRLAGVVQTAWIEWLLFPVIALVTLRLFRQPLLGRMRVNEGPDLVDALVGEVAFAMGDIAPGQHGRAELRGSGWSARNVDTSTLIAGQRCRVVAVHGLMLDLRQE